MNIQRSSQRLYAATRLAKTIGFSCCPACVLPLRCLRPCGGGAGGELCCVLCRRPALIGLADLVGFHAGADSGCEGCEPSLYLPSVACRPPPSAKTTKSDRDCFVERGDGAGEARGCEGGCGAAALSVAPSVLMLTLAAPARPSESECANAAVIHVFAAFLANIAWSSPLAIPRCTCVVRTTSEPYCGCGLAAT